MKVYHVKQSKVYHTDLECWMLQRQSKGKQEWDEQLAIQWGHSKCQWCDD